MISVHKAVKSRLLSGRLVISLVAAVGYFMFAAITISLTSDGRNHATVWPADAVILSLLLCAPKRHWPYILLAGWAGNLVANGITRGWVAGLILYGAINMGQAWLAARFLRRSEADANLLADPHTVGRFILWAGLVAPLAGAFTGSLVSWLNYGEPFIPSFVRWYSSNALGFLVFTPFLKALFDGSYASCFASRSLAQRGEAAALIVAHAALCAFVFMQRDLPLLFLPISSLLLLSFRLGRQATMAGVMIVAIVGAVAAIDHTGPMALIHGSGVFEAVFFQIYLAILLATTLPVAAIVSSRMEALTSLAEREETLRLIMANSPDAVLSFDADGICRWADGPLQEFFGLDASMFKGASLLDLASQTSDELIHMHMADGSDHTSPKTVEFSPLYRPFVTIEASLRTLGRAGHPMGTVITLRDITSRKAREIAITRRAETDDLTGVLNRAGFRQKMKQALEETSRPTSLALIDVDYFKSINDSYGHPVGDAVLVEIARRLQAGTREADVVGRLGGDEFAILFRCDLDMAQAACERIALAVAREPVFSEGPLLVLASVSCGVAEFCPGSSRAQLFDRADAALYEVKRTGRNGVHAAA